MEVYSIRESQYLLPALAYMLHHFSKQLRTVRLQQDVRSCETWIRIKNDRDYLHPVHHKPGISLRRTRYVVFWIPMHIHGSPLSRNKALCKSCPCDTSRSTSILGSGFTCYCSTSWSYSLPPELPHAARNHKKYLDCSESKNKPSRSTGEIAW